MSQTASRSGTSSNAALLIGWGNVLQGREQKAPQILSETLAYYKQLQDRGEIDSYDPIMLEPHGRDLTGLVLLKGSRENLNRIRNSDEFTRLCSKAQLVTTSVDVIGGFTGEAFDRQVHNWQQVSREFA